MGVSASGRVVSATTDRRRTIVPYSWTDTGDFSSPRRAFSAAGLSTRQAALRLNGCLERVDHYKLLEGG